MKVSLKLTRYEFTNDLENVLNIIQEQLGIIPKFAEMSPSKLTLDFEEMALSAEKEIALQQIIQNAYPQFKFKSKSSKLKEVGE